jgi:hypothetical protein
MKSDRIQRGLPELYWPTPEEIEQAMRRGERLRAQAFRDITRAAAAWLARAFRRGEVGPAQADVSAKHAPAA